MACNSSLCQGAMAGDYRIVRKLAEGGMGEVFIVHDTTQGGDSTCVLKSVLCACNGDAKEALKEAKVLKDIRHPHVVQYLDVFPNQEAYKGIIAVCTVMEYCERGDLAAHLSNLKKRQNGGGKGLKEPAIIMWVSQLLQALAHLHSIQIIHRDMKPHNVFITSKCNLKIGDFGLAKSLERSKATSRVGTPAYIAPEVLQYDGYGPPVDVWGVGCLAFEMMTLDLLSERQGMLASDVQRKPVRSDQFPPSYNDGLRNVVSAMLQANPQARPTASISLGLVDEMIQRMGGAAACYMHLQEQAVEGGEARGGSASISSAASGGWHRKTPSRLAAAAAPSLRPESAIDEMEPEPPAAGGAAAGQEGGIIGLLQGFGQVDFFGLGRSGGSGGGDVGGMYRVPEGPSDAPAAEDAGGDGGVRDGLGGMGLGTVWGTPWVGSSLFGAGGEGGFAAPWDAATPGGTRPAVEQPNTGQVRAAFAEFDDGEDGGRGVTDHVGARLTEGSGASSARGRMMVAFEGSRDALPLGSSEAVFSLVPEPIMGQGRDGSGKGGVGHLRAGSAAQGQGRSSTVNWARAADDDLSGSAVKWKDAHGRGEREVKWKDAPGRGRPGEALEGGAALAEGARLAKTGASAGAGAAGGASPPDRGKGKGTEDKSKRTGVARFVATPVAKNVVAWEAVTGADAEVPRGGAPTLEWASVDGASVGDTRQRINAAGAHVKAAAGGGGRIGNRGGSARNGGDGVDAEDGSARGLKDGLSQSEIDAAKRKRALAAARNPGGRGGQWVRGEKGEMEWVTAAEYEAREEERRKMADALLRAREAEKSQRVNHEQRVKAELAAAPRRAQHLASIGARSQLEEKAREETSERDAQGSRFSAMAAFGRRKSGRDGGDGPGVVGAGAGVGGGGGAAGGREPGGRGASGGLQKVGGNLMRQVMHGPLTYRLTYDANKWEQASTKTQELVRQQYIMELPPGLEPDPSIFKSSTISVDDDAVDRQYRKLFGPPDAKAV